MFGNYEHHSQLQILEEIRAEGLSWVIDTIEWSGVEQARYELFETVSWVDDYEHFVLGYEVPEGHETVGWEERRRIEAIILDALQELCATQQDRILLGLNEEIRNLDHQDSDNPA